MVELCIFTAVSTFKGANSSFTSSLHSRLLGNYELKITHCERVDRKSVE